MNKTDISLLKSPVFIVALIALIIAVLSNFRSIDPIDNTNIKLEISKLKTSLNTLSNKLQNDQEMSFAGEPGQSVEDAANIKNQINALSDKIAQISAQFSDAKPVDLNSQSIDPQELRRKQEENDRNLKALYAQTISSEQPDPEWSIATEEQTKLSMSAMSEKIELKDVECKSTLCRLSFVKTADTSDDEAIESFDSGVLWKGPISMTYNPKTGDAEVYLAREGFELPTLEN